MELTIKVKDLKPGMYLTKICGSWLAHPFWKRKFILEKEDIELLKGSTILEVVIDLNEGINPITEYQHEITNIAPILKDSNILKKVNKQIVDELKSNITIEDKKTTIVEEAKKARLIIKKSNIVVKNLFNEARMGNALNEDIYKELVDEISTSIFRNPDALLSIIRLKTKDEYTYMHSVAVCALMISLAKNLGYEPEFCKKAGLAGLYHDIGKMFIPLEILNKPGKLNDDEYSLVKNHPKRGWELLKKAGVTNEEVLDVCLHHHEKIDGTGYPDRLKSDEISVLAKMGTICDVYDAITSNRPYKNGWIPHESIKKMAEWNTHFDQNIFLSFVKMIGIYPVGSIVKLSNGKIGVVLNKGEKSLLKPIVKVFYSTKSECMINPEIIDLSLSHIKETIVSLHKQEDYNFGDLSNLWLN